MSEQLQPLLDVVWHSCSKKPPTVGVYVIVALVVALAVVSCRGPQTALS